MSDQDAQDINQMMSSNPEVPIVTPKKSKLIWVVLGCMVLGVGLGVVVYQQSISSPVSTTRSTPKPTVVSTPTPTPEDLVPTLPQTNVVTPAGNSVVFPKAGKIRLYSNIGLAQTMTINIAGQPSEINIPASTITSTIPMISGDSTFSVSANSTANFDLYINGRSGTKMRGWIPPVDSDHKKCGISPDVAENFETALAYATTKLGGETVFLFQCWEDNNDPGEFNDIYMLWTYVPVAGTATSPSPSAIASTAASSSPSLSPSPSPSRDASPSPSPSRAASPSPSPSVRASVAASVVATTPTPTPVASPRVSMPDTTDGTPVTGIFEITVGTISVGIVFLLLGLFGLLVL